MRLSSVNRSVRVVSKLPQKCLYSPLFATHCNMFDALKHFRRVFKTPFSDYFDLHKYTSIHPQEFWNELWDLFDLVGTKRIENENTDILNTPTNSMADAVFFQKSSLNFAENCIGNIRLFNPKNNEDKKIVFYAENILGRNYTSAFLYSSVAVMSNWLRNIKGIRKGDVVCGVVSNSPETLVMFLSTISIGGVWSSVSPDFGPDAIFERFSQIKPKLICWSDSIILRNKILPSNYEDKIQYFNDRMSNDFCSHFILPLGGDSIRSGDYFDILEQGLHNHNDIYFEETNFNDPAFILFSSGTTGKPKCIIHRHGVLLQLKKEHTLHCDLRPNDVMFYYTTTSWMMYHWLIGSLASGANLLLYEGSPMSPTKDSLLRLCDYEKVKVFGVSAKYIDSLRIAGIDIRRNKARYLEEEETSQYRRNFLESVSIICSTGSPLSRENFNYVYSSIKKDVLLASISGGTDILSCFMLGNPMLPVYPGEIQCAGLGMAIETRRDDSSPVGELVCVQPFPSMPIGLYGDDENKTKFKETYFQKKELKTTTSDFVDEWVHGDFVEQSSSTKGWIMHGRSDATLNPGGVRIGSADIYGVIHGDFYREIEESVVTGYSENEGNEESIVLFVKMFNNNKLTSELIREIQEKILTKLSRHHVPKRIIQVPRGVPKTKNGKISELSVKRKINNQSLGNENALENPEVLEDFKL